MMTFSDLASVPSDPPAPFTDRLRLAVAAYLARFKGSSREHTESDLRCYLTWCAEHGLDPLAAQRAHLDLFFAHGISLVEPTGSADVDAEEVQQSGLEAGGFRDHGGVASWSQADHGDQGGDAAVGLQEQGGNRVRADLLPANYDCRPRRDPLA